MTPKELIETITWYRDEYHKSDFGHNNMLAKLELLKDKRLSKKESETVEEIEKAVDGWLDQPSP
jgi:hypothetical protein